jgi:siroheme synthase
VCTLGSLCATAAELQIGSPAVIVIGNVLLGIAAQADAALPLVPSTAVSRAASTATAMDRAA